MRRVSCHECKRQYDFDVDDFCPRCGAFTQPERSSRIDANGSVVRIDGINERNHRGSFVHKELHDENRERRGNGLSKDVKQGATDSLGPKVAAQIRGASAGQTKKLKPIHIVAVVVLLNILFNLLGALFTFVF